MEKFGIFELLDALSALTAKKDEQSAPPVSASSAPSVSPSAEDAAFAPPQYIPDQREKDPVPDTQAEEPPRHDALSDFYARHNAVARKAKK